MSSKFIAGPGVPQPPPICRKSVPANFNPSYPPWMVQAWLQVNAVADDGTELVINRTITLDQTFSSPLIYNANFQQKPYLVQVFWIKEAIPQQWSFSVFTLANPNFDQIAAIKNNIRVISEDPMNSGIQQIPITAGSGKATARVML